MTFFLKILPSNNLLMYCVHSNNYPAFNVLVSLNADLLWRNSTDANIMQVIAKKGRTSWAKLCWENMVRCQDKYSDEDKKAFLTNEDHRG